MYNTFQGNKQPYVPLQGHTTGNSTVDTLLGAGLDQIGGLAPYPREGQSITDAINEAARAKEVRQVMLGGIQQHPVTQLLGGLTKGALLKKADMLGDAAKWTSDALAYPAAVLTYHSRLPEQPNPLNYARSGGMFDRIMPNSNQELANSDNNHHTMPGSPING